MLFFNARQTFYIFFFLFLFRPGDIISCRSYGVLLISFNNCIFFFFLLHFNRNMRFFYILCVLGVCLVRTNTRAARETEGENYLGVRWTAEFIYFMCRRHRTAVIRGRCLFPNSTGNGILEVGVFVGSIETDVQCPRLTLRLCFGVSALVVTIKYYNGHDKTATQHLLRSTKNITKTVS